MKKTRCQKLMNQVLCTIFLLFTSCDIPSFSKTSFELVNSENSEEKQWQVGLTDSFRKHHKTAQGVHSKKMRETHPIIVQDLLNMTFIRSNGEKLRFSMDEKVYSTLAHSSHPPLTLYLILKSSDFKLDNDSTVLKLKDYNLVLENAIGGIKELDYLTEIQKERNLMIFNLSQQFIQKILSNKASSKDEFLMFSKSVRKPLEDNLYDGAKVQLTQFYDKLKNWKFQFPDENWDDLRVVIMGFHQSRELYVLKLLFQCLLGEPEIEKRVVFAEFQFSILGDKTEEAQDFALKLLEKVDFDKEVSYFLFGDQTLLQKDVMGPAAVKILRKWNFREWFLEELA